MKIEVIKEKRRTVVLTLVDAERAVLKVPKNFSDKKVTEFLDGKEKWLEKKTKMMKQNEQFSKDFDIMRYFYLFGEKIDLLSNLIFGFENLTEREKLLAIRKTYLAHFSNLEDIAKKLSLETGFRYEKTKSIDSVRIWGSFSSTRIMKLNWKLLILPENLIRYVVYHELCHSKHMNHKPQFWKEVSRFCPDYKALREELKKYSFLLKRSV